jgi:Zn-dependent membrane protease YugP
MSIRNLIQTLSTLALSIGLIILVLGLFLGSGELIGWGTKLVAAGIIGNLLLRLIS